MNEKHLKPHLDYSDLYDRHTVDMCRRTEQNFAKDDDIPRSKKITKKQAERIKAVAKELYLRAEMGERYLNKEKTIREWMDADRQRDELYESAQAPENIRCLTCRNLLKPMFKQFWSGIDDKPDRVLFMYDCPNNCLPRRAFFSDGEEWRSKPNLCPQCSSPLKQKENDDGKKVVTTYTCPKCKYTKKDEYEWTHKKEKEIDLDFAKDRDRFCMTDEEGKKYQEEKWQLERFAKFADEWKEKQKARDEKLKANPKGFHLDGVGYTCAICGNGTAEGDNWYDKWGIKCLVCQKAIDDGEIPASLAKNKDSWYSRYDMESRFNIRGATLSSWVRKGIIKARTVSYYGKNTHYQLFVIKDNEGFLPPKKLVESQSVKEIKDGKEWHSSLPWYRFEGAEGRLRGYGIMNHLKFVKIDETKAEE